MCVYNNNKSGLYTTYLRILIKDVHRNAITMKIYMSTITNIQHQGILLNSKCSFQVFCSYTFLLF